MPAMAATRQIAIESLFVVMLLALAVLFVGGG
jgi:hypothetical protein